MNIRDYLKIDTVYTRSINIERDYKSKEIVDAYIPTSRAILTLNRIADTLNLENVPRSWALIGPYGSGKSSFAVFLSHLFGDPENEYSEAALTKINKADKKLGKILTKDIKNSKGYLPVLITGSPEPFARRLLSSLLDASVNYWAKRPGPTPSIVEKIKSLVEEKDIAPNTIISIIEDLQLSISKGNGKGIIFLFDEFGKFLEYEARHSETNDIYLMQLLAELARIGNEANVFVFAFMHQGFEQYAKGLGEKLRNEWAKIQGRYENIPFLESTEQTLRVMSKAFQSELEKDQKEKIQKKCKKIVKILSKNKALPNGLDENTALKLLSQCYPLHPLSALILPLLCQRMAQNERTLFSYLGSKETFGFRDRLDNIDTIGQWVFPWEIYEYFILNQPAIIDDPTTHRRWAEVVTAIERLGDAPSEQINLLKAIGLLNISGAHGGLKASKEIISLCLPKKIAANEAAKQLLNKSLIQYRKYSSEYRVWQGSDFDIDLAVQDELNQLGIFNLPEAINNRKAMQPIVARRFTIHTGALRYFQPIFVDQSSYIKEPKKASQQRIILFLSETSEDNDIFLNNVVTYFSELDIIAFCPNSSRLRESVGEVITLDRIAATRQELNTDPVAKREFKDRMTAAEQLEDSLLASFIDNPQNNVWYWKGDNLIVSSKRELQSTLSDILERIYFNSPIFKNELINRDKPSAQAIAARNKLILALRYNEEKEDLGIDKFPAEKGIYRALFKATRLHKMVNGVWKLVPPEFENAEDDEYKIQPVWDRINSFLSSTEKIPKSFAELDEELASPPFGIKAGVLPLLYFTAYNCYQDDLALYENGIYVPYITDQHIDRFIKRPDLFTIQRVWISGIRASLFKQYIKVLYGEGHQKRTLLSIARPLAKFIADLEEYTKNTSRISDTAQKVRKAFNIAKSPDDLLFNILPKACGFEKIDNEIADDKKVEKFTVSLVEVIRELKNTYQDMLKDMVNILSTALLPDFKEELSLSEFRQKVCSRYEDLHQYTADVKGLRPFIEYLATKNGDDEAWLQRLLLFLGNKAPKRWSDVDRDGVVFRISEFSKRLIDLRILQDHYLKKQSRFSNDFDVVLIRSMRHGSRDYDEIVTIDKEQRKYLSGTKDKIDELLNALRDDEARLALLAEIVDEFMANKNKQTKSKKQIRSVNE